MSSETAEVGKGEGGIVAQQHHNKKWHKMSEEAPPIGARLLVADKGGLVCIADYFVQDGKMRWNFDGGWNFLPVAWQLCPEFDPNYDDHLAQHSHTWLGKAKGLLPDYEIAALCEGDMPMITPFTAHQVRTDERNNPIISYGLSSAGYDMRLGPYAYVVKYPIGGYISPKYPVHSETPTRHADGGYIISPNRTLIGASVEHFRLPPDVMCVIVGKSTYARCGIHVLTTPAEPEWEGHLTLEISNLNPEPAIIYPDEGIAQCLFFRLSNRPNVTYADRSGKYQNQPPRPIASRL